MNLISFFSTAADGPPADERLCTALVLLRYGQVIRFSFTSTVVGRRVFVLSSGWLASYSGSVGGACINNTTVFFSDGYKPREKGTLEAFYPL